MRGLPTQPGSVFVGREAEVALLRAALATAIAGHGRVVMVAGEPGIGKTRLAEEIARLAGAEGATVRWGRCWEGAGAPAFWPWIQILRAQFAETDAAELRVQLGAGAGGVAQLAPELRERLPDIVPAPVVEDAGARFRLYDSVASFLRSAALRRPLTVVLEDIHWADAASLGLLHFLLDEMQDARLLIVATCRDSAVRAAQPLSEVMGALAYHPLVQRVELQGLSAEEIGVLIEAQGREASASLVERIHRQSGGNPFFATEFARAPDGAGIPDSVRDAIGNRLRQLSEGCNRLLGIAAVIGPDFGLGTLERAAAEVGDCVLVLRLLNEATDAHIVVEAPPAAGGYRFTHALIREVVYTALPLEVRPRLHWQVGTALEELGGPSREHGASALAHQFSEAIAGCAQGAPRQACVDKAVLYTTKAAEQATAMCAYKDAAALYERALPLLEAWAAHDRRRQCELLLAMGKAQTRAAARYAVRSKTFHRAAALAREIEAPQLLVRAAFGLSTRSLVHEAANDTHIALLGEALDAVGPQDSAERARLLGYLAQASYLPDPRLHSFALSEEALAIGRRVGDPRTLWSVLCSRYVVLEGRGGAEERMALATEILELGEQRGSREEALMGRLFRLYELLALGQIAALERELAEFTRLADELRQPAFCLRAAAMRATLAFLDGRLADAEQLALEAMQVTSRAENPDPFIGFYAAQLYLIRWEQGRLGEIESLLGVFEQFPSGNWRALLVHFHAEEGHAAEASAILDRLGADNFGTLRRTIDWLSLMALLADACVTLGDTVHAPTLYQLLLPYAKDLVASGWPIFLGSTSFFLGQLAGLLSRHDEALRHLQEALDIHVQMGSRPWIANTQWATAAALVGRNGPGDRERAAALLGEVLDTTERLGMRRLQRKALALREQMNAGMTAGIDNTESHAASAPQPLTATFRKEGEYWVIGHTAPPFRLKDRLGLRYLAVLLRNPGREFLAIDLVGALHGGKEEPTSRDGAARPALGGPEPYFDAQARRDYAQRLRDLRAALEEALAFNDRERASRTQEEIDFLTDELQRGLGLGRRVRASGSPIERARVSVTQAIKTALRAIADNEAELGHYLAATIKTGTFCSYSPDRRVPVRWQL